ncbi:unnamed protein product, partial [Rotaria sp. Silwood2]
MSEGVGYPHLLSTLKRSTG